MRAETLVQLLVRALAEKPYVERAEHRAIRIDVDDDPLRVPVACTQEIARALFDRALEETGNVALAQCGNRLAVASRDVDMVGARHEGPQQQAVAHRVHAEHGERVAMTARHDRLDGRASEGARGGHAV